MGAGNHLRDRGSGPENGSGWPGRARRCFQCVLRTVPPPAALTSGPPSKVGRFDGPPRSPLAVRVDHCETGQMAIVEEHLQASVRLDEAVRRTLHQPGPGAHSLIQGEIRTRPGATKAGRACATGGTNRSGFQPSGAATWPGGGNSPRSTGPGRSTYQERHGVIGLRSRGAGRYLIGAWSPPRACLSRCPSTAHYSPVLQRPNHLPTAARLTTLP